MGGIWIARDASDIVFVDDDASKLPDVVRMSRRTLLTIRAGVAFSMIFNSATIVLAVFGMLGPVAGALVHNIGPVIAVIFAAMLLRYDCWNSRTGTPSADVSPVAE